MKILIITFLLLCVVLSSVVDAEETVIPTQPKNYSSSFSLAFGSCNDHNLDQSYWNTLLDHKKSSSSFVYDLFIWLGDIVYLDIAPWTPYLPHHYYRDEDSAKEIWQAMKDDPFYTNFRSKTRFIFGTGDDHDGTMLNDAGKESVMRKFAQEQILNFLDVPPASPDNREATVRRNERDGYYAFHKIPFAGFENDPSAKPICVILLDFRAGRERPIATEDGSRVMTEKQWKWFSHALKTGMDLEIDGEVVGGEDTTTVSSIDDVCAVTFIGSSVQVIFDSAGMETWGEYPAERNRLLREIAKSTARRITLLSGDIHYIEAGLLSHTPVTLKGDGIHDNDPSHLPSLDNESAQLFEKCPESIWPDQDLYELTSSGLTHHEDRNLFDESRYNRWFPSHRRLEPGVWIFKNVGLIDVVCSDIRDGETCRVFSSLRELPSMKEIFNIEPKFVPRSKQITFGEEANKYFREKYPHCPHLHDIGNTYKLPPYPALWTRWIDYTKLYVPFCYEMGRLDVIFLQFYSVLFAALGVVLMLVVILINWCCCGPNSKKTLKSNKDAVQKQKKDQ